MVYCMEGIFIPNEILKVKELTSTEKMVLALYKYYTEQGKNKCCSLTKPQIAEDLGISVDYVKKIKNHLKGLGYIKTDGGIRVIYVGVQGGNRVPIGGEYSTHQGVIEYPVGGNRVPTRGVIEYPHKKEKKEKKDKKEEKKGMTNFDLLIDKLPSEYKTQEKIDYIKNKYMDRLNELDLNIGGMFDLCLTRIKSELNQRYPMKYHIINEEPISDTIDVL